MLAVPNTRVPAAVPGHHFRPRLALGGRILRQAGQRVELREDADHRPAGAVRRDERGRHAGDAASTVKPLARSRSCSSFDDFTSSSPVSAQPQMLRLTRLSVDAFASIHASAAVFGSDWRRS